MLNLKVEKIADLLNGIVIGDSNIIIYEVKPLESASAGDLSFYYLDKYEDSFNKTNASCVIISNNNNSAPKENQAFIKVEKPYHSFVKLLKMIEADKEKLQPMIHKSAVIDENCEITSEVSISANCVIGKNVKIDSGTILKPGVIIYDNVNIGKNTIINSNAVIYQDVRIGDNCIIHAGAVIGSDGFGYIENKEDGSYDKVPQLGNVVIEDDVEIGANTTIDCALIGSTIIRRGTKIDNLVHIAHNCEIGENTGIAAQTGISGSVVTGKRNRFGGQVGIAGHLEITDDVIIFAQSGVSKSIAKSGIYFGSPVKEHLKAFKIEAVLRKLPELASEVNDLSKKINEISNKNGE